jgi:hypothetical protein
MTTWWIVFERRKGSKCWTATDSGLNTYSRFKASEELALEDVAYRESREGYAEKWETKIVKVDVPH